MVSKAPRASEGMRSSKISKTAARRLCGGASTAVALLGAVLFLSLSGLGEGDASAARPQSAPVSLVIWTGGLSPLEDLVGVKMGPDGRGSVIVTRAGPDRLARRISAGGFFKASSKQLAEIRRAATAALKARYVTTLPERTTVHDGFYVSASVKVGSKTRTLLGFNTSSGAVRDLVEAVNAAIPESKRLDPVAEFTPVRTAAKSIPRATCTSGLPTSFSRADIEMSLKEAAQAGVVQITSKGGFSGDVVAVDAQWKASLSAPAKIDINIEVTSPKGSSYAGQIEQAVEKRLAGVKTSDGSPVSFDLHVQERGQGTSPTACFHQIEITRERGHRSYVYEYKNGSMEPSAGEWIVDEKVWVHEVLHLAGLDDAYEDFFVIGDESVPIPRDKFDVTDRQALEDWAKSQTWKSGQTDPKKGQVESRIKKGHEKDVMADHTKGTLQQGDIDKLGGSATGGGRITIRGKPGDLLLNKYGSDQNLGVGADFEVTVSQTEPTAHRDGMVAYCIDHDRSEPGRGQVLDVLGLAGEQAEPGMPELQRVLEEVARRQPAPLAPTPGAQRAVWRVTDDDTFLLSSNTLAILAAAGIPPDKSFGATHFYDPNAGSDNTAAVAASGVLPTIPPRQPAVAQQPVLAGVSLLSSRLRTQRSTVLAVNVNLAGTGDNVSLAVQRRSGKRWTTLPIRYSRSLEEGESLFSLVLRRPRPGSYQVVATARSGSKTAAFKVSKAQKKTKKKAKKKRRRVRRR